MNRSQKFITSLFSPGLQVIFDIIEHSRLQLRGPITAMRTQPVTIPRQHIHIVFVHLKDPNFVHLISGHHTQLLYGAAVITGLVHNLDR
jgi:hypothetical protein